MATFDTAQYNFQDLLTAPQLILVSITGVPDNPNRLVFQNDSRPMYFPAPVVVFQTLSAGTPVAFNLPPAWVYTTNTFIPKFPVVAPIINTVSIGVKAGYTASFVEVANPLL